MPLNTCIVAQSGTLAYQALVFAASLRRHSGPDTVRLFVCVPEYTDNWTSDPAIEDAEILAAFDALDCDVVRFVNKRFGSEYPISNKIYALEALPPGEPFVFFDTDVIVTGDLSEIPFDFARPSADRPGQHWPKGGRHGPAEIWAALYGKFGIPTEGWFRAGHADTDPRRYPYFNAGCFYYRCPAEFGAVFQEIMHALADDRPAELAEQAIYPWLDQIVLPLVLARLGGDPDGFPRAFVNRTHSFHYHAIPNLFMDRHKARLAAFRDVMADPRFTAIFRRSPSHGFFFFQTADRLVEHLVRANAYGKDGPSLRKALNGLKLWRK